MAKIALFASGSGSNAVVLAKAFAREVVCVIVDREDAAVIAKLEALGVAVYVTAQKKKQDREEAILKILANHEVEWCVLAGFMRILSAQFLEHFADPRGVNRVVNIHPALLPSFKGASGYQDAFEYGVRVGGITVHFVDAGVDSGPIIDQEAFVINSCDDLESIISKGKDIEHRLFPRALRKVLSGDWKVIERGERKVIL